MKPTLALWLAVLMFAAQPIQAAVCVGFGQSTGSADLAYESYSSSYIASTSDTSLTIPTPSGVSSGDELVAIFSMAKIRTVTPPAGWSAISPTDQLVKSFRKTAGSSEPTDYTFTLDAATSSAHAAIVRISGGSIDAITMETPAENTTWNTTVNFTAPTVGTSGAIVLWVSLKNSDTTSRVLSSITRGTLIYANNGGAAAFPLWLSVEESVVAGAPITSAVGTLDSADSFKYGTAIVIER